jgi:hypothetical protein
VSVAVTAAACRGRSFPYLSHHNSTSGDVSMPVIGMCEGVRFVMDINMEGLITCKYF